MAIIRIQLGPVKLFEAFLRSLEREGCMGGRAEARRPHNPDYSGTVLRLGRVGARSGLTGKFGLLRSC